MATAGGVVQPPLTHDRVEMSLTCEPLRIRFTIYNFYAFDANNCQKVCFYTRFFYKQPGCLGARPQICPKSKQQAKQLETSNFLQAKFLVIIWVYCVCQVEKFRLRRT